MEKIGEKMIIEISDETWRRLGENGEVFVDTVDSVISKALDALDEMNFQDGEKEKNNEKKEDRIHESENILMKLNGSDAVYSNLKSMSKHFAFEKCSVVGFLFENNCSNRSDLKEVYLDFVERTENKVNQKDIEMEMSEMVVIEKIIKKSKKVNCPFTMSLNDCRGNNLKIYC